VRFRLSGLLLEQPESDASESQPAAIPVLLTLLFLSEWITGTGGSVLDTSYELLGPDIDPCESDVVAVSWAGRPEPHVHVLIGECKGQGRVDEADLLKLSRAAERLRNDVIECDLLFATTRDSFADEELALFRTLYEGSSEWEQLRKGPLILTSRELDRSRYSGGQDGPDGFGPGFRPLIEWSTRRYFDEAAVE